MLDNAKRVAHGVLTGRLASIQLHGSAEDAELENRLPLHIGDKVDAESFERLVKAVHAINPNLHIGLDTDQSGDISLHIFPETANLAVKEQ